MAEPITSLELKVSKRLREVVGAVIGAVLLTVFLVFFVSVAIYDLINFIAYIPSILWLALVGILVRAFFKEKGASQGLIDIVGAFAPREFFWTILLGDTAKEIHYGYEIFGRRFYYWKIPVDKVTQLNWSKGQASHIVGRDMNDWSVFIWYEHGDSAKMLKNSFGKNPDQDLHIVRSPGKKEETAVFGLSLLEFLRKSGALLIPGKDECHFGRDPVAPNDCVN